MTIEAFLKLLIELTYKKFANSEWYIQYSAVEDAVMLYVANGVPGEEAHGFKWMRSFIEHTSAQTATIGIEEGIATIARKTVIPRG